MRERAAPRIGRRRGRRRAHGRVTFMYPTLFKIPYLPDWLADVKSYGVMMMIAFLSGIWLSCRRADRTQGNADIVLNIGFISLIFGVIGARAMYVIHYWDTRFATQPNPILATVDIRSGGLEFWGGPLLTIPALAIYLRCFAKVSIRWYLDMTAPALAWGLAITRIGCFLNGCCWGSTCVDPQDAGRQRAEFPWAVQFPYGSPAMVQQYRFGQLTIPKELIYALSSGESMPVPRDYFDVALADDGQTRRRLDERYAQSLKDLSAAQAEGADSPSYKSAREMEHAAREALAGHPATVVGAVENQALRYGMNVKELWQLAQHYHSRPIHPTQLYEMISALLICWLLSKMFYYRRRHGVVLPWFLVLYSCSRLLHESLRQDNPLDVAGVTISQAISIATLIAGLFLLWLIYTRMPLRSPRAAPFVLPETEPPTARKR